MTVIQIGIKDQGVGKRKELNSQDSHHLPKTKPFSQKGQHKIKYGLWMKNTKLFKRLKIPQLAIQEIQRISSKRTKKTMII